MDKYEYRVKTEQLLEYTEHKEYRKAMEIADTIDWRRVKSTSMLNTVSEVYEYCGEYKKSRDILFMAFDRAPGSRKIVYRLGTLALKVNDPDEASDCYEEFVKLAPKDPNQYILKYKIQKAQGAPLQEQIETLEEFKKAEYIEKWAYELANLYHQAGMVSECIEECDDLILWFSEGKYVRLAMELKMKYKPLTPLQQEKYEGRFEGTQESSSYDEEAEEAQEEPAEEISEQKEEGLQEESGAEAQPEEAEEAPEETEEEPAETEEAVAESETSVEELTQEIPSSEEREPAEEETESAPEKPVQKEKPRASITRVVTGATFEEALASGVAMAAGINQEEKAMAERDEELRISGQMKIEEILQEWEEKQKVNADAIERQKAEDQERLRREREEAEKRMEADRRAVEEAARKAQAEAARKAQEEAAKKAAEEAARKAAEEAAAKKAAEEAAKKAAEEEAAKKAAEEAAKKAAEEEAAKKAAEEAAKKAAEEEAAKKAAEEEAAKKAAEEEAAKKAAEEEAAKKAAEEEAAKKAAEEEAARKMLEQLSGIREPQKDILEEKTQRLPDDILELVEQLENRVAATSVRKGEKIAEEDLEDDFDEDGFADRDFIEGEFEDDFDESGFAEDDFDEDEFVEDEFDEEDLAAQAELGETEDGYEGFEEGELEDDYEEFEEGELEDDYEEFEESKLEDDYEEFEESELEDDYEEFEESELEDDYEEFEESELEDGYEEFEESELEDGYEEFEEGKLEDGYEEFEESELEDDYEEFEEGELEDDYEEFEEDELEDDYEEEFEEGELEDGYEEEFEEGELEDDYEEEFEEEELEIEEPSEEEIQKRFNKSKGGVPFNTGFVVTGRYDLNATSEIGLKVGLTEEQKKLFSYFVPVRGMSEQIVEVLDNDRRARREGTSKTGNLLVIGRKGSGKTVLAVDIVKAIQKQRNLKQGKVAIVTGESLNKKELPNIIQKLRGGAIIVEKAGKLNSRTVKELNRLMERKTGEMLFVLEDQRKPLEKMLMANPEFKKKFTSKLELPIFINDELVTFGQTYAKENGYKLDEMGILALYSRIDVMQREDHAVSVAEVKEIMDEAISHSQRANVKHLARRVFGKGTDESDRIILKEEDFKI